jgi:acyl-CoA synthetase (AMP-forming)/AMP-acid ligase II
MTGTVWDQEFFRRRAAGEQEAGLTQEPTEATPLTSGHATIAELLLARAEDDNTALLFEDQRWSWRELVLQAATRSALMQQLRPQEGPRHVRVLMENTPEYILLTAGAALCGATVVGINPTRRGAELAADIRGTDCAVIVTDDAYGDLLDGAGPSAKSSPAVPRLASRATTRTPRRAWTDCGTATSGPAISATATRTASTGSPGVRLTGSVWTRRTSRPPPSSGS